MGRACILACILLLAACSSGGSGAPGGAAAGPGSISRLGVLKEGASDSGFARALTVRPFVFPQDQGPHPAYPHEWWYWTGHLHTRAGERFGFELIVFRIALRPPDSIVVASAMPALESRWRTRQIYVAHFAITDIEHKEFHSAQRFARAALGLAGAQATPFRVWLGGWSVAQEATPTLSASSGVWVLRAADPAYALTLQLRPHSPAVLNGDHGLSIKSDVPGSASYYYSIPRVAVEGQLVRGGRAMDVSGTAWLDREWGSGGLGPNEQGWDWFALQLKDGSALMFYSLRDSDGARDPHSAGTWIGADGRTRALANDDVRIDVLSHWKSPRGIIYPSRWRIRVSSLGLDVEATPVLADQELDTRPVYWEGDVDVAGTRNGEALSGQGYVELVGYPGR